MILESKYDLGQEVWSIHTTHEHVSLPCLFCRGAKYLKVSGPTEDVYESVPCPRCQGRGSVALVTIPVWAVDSSPMTIGMVRVEVKQSPGLPGGSRFTNYSAQDGREESYMCVETGVGSGSIHRVERLYPSKEAAQDDVYEMNEATREGRGTWRPDYSDVERARSFLTHRDVYEHTDKHVELAQRIIAAFETKEEESDGAVS